jgi:hypothetical protein
VDYFCFDLFESLHDIVLTAAEVVVQAQVFSIQPIINPGIYQVGVVDLSFEMGHVFGGFENTVLAASGFPSGDGAKHG